MERRGPCRDGRRHAVLARSRGRWLPRGRGARPGQRSRPPKQSALPHVRLAAPPELGPRGSARDPPALAQDPRLLPGRSHGRRRGRRAQPPTAGTLLRARRRAAALVQLPFPRAALARRALPGGGRTMGEAAVRRVVARLHALEPRPIPRRDTLRARSRGGRRDDAPHAPGQSVPVLRRRDRDDRRGHPTGAPPRHRWP